jgi:hypothetical protein
MCSHQNEEEVHPDSQAVSPKGKPEGSKQLTRSSEARTGHQQQMQQQAVLGSFKARQVPPYIA